MLLLLFIGLSLCVASPSPAHAQSYDQTCCTEVDYAIDSVGLPYDFHNIAWRESRDIPTAGYPYTCGPFQFLSSTAWNMQYVPTSSRFGNGYGYTCAELTNPWTAAVAAKELYLYLDYSPWMLTVS